MGSQEYYDILGLSRNASEEEIKRAYRRNAKRYHPDRNPEDKTAEARFKRVQEAYEVLGDKQKRTQYDRFGKAGVGRVVDQNGQRFYTWGGGSNVNLDELDDLFTAFGGAGGQSYGGAGIFEQIFGKRGQGSGRHRKPPPAALRGQDIEHPVNLTFEQAIYGMQIDINLVATDGRGQRKQTLSVKIPPNVHNSQRIRIGGKGNPGRDNGPPGDLFIVCNVKPHPYFGRRGGDILLDVPISITEAALGAKVDVPTLGGLVTITIPPGTTGGTRLRLKGRGVGAANGNPAGDQIVAVQIVAPKNLNHRQRQAVEKLAKELEDDPRSGLGWPH